MRFGGHPIPDREWLSTWAAGRATSLFRSDIERRRAEIAGMFEGSRVLVVGGAGSIGSQTVRQIADVVPDALHVVDLSENGLATLVRDLRSRPGGIRVPEFVTAPLDFGSSVFRRFVEEQGPYDHVLNFAAIKHVRSERDVVSILHMFDTNVLKPIRLMDLIHSRGGASSFFTVSTDKAANPVNLMGASKRLMEEVVFRHPAVMDGTIRASAARFANVAFSNGSLLDAWVTRMQKVQPLAVPADVRRFLVSLNESGELCLLSSALGPTQATCIPRPGQLELQPLADIARRFLVGLGWVVSEYETEEKAWSSLDSDTSLGRYPLLLTELDTAGEKPYEEFVGTGESASEMGLRSLVSLPWVPCEPEPLERLVSELGTMVAGAGARSGESKASLVELVSDALPSFRHFETGKRLDDRM